MTEYPEYTWRVFAQEYVYTNPSENKSTNLQVNRQVLGDFPTEAQAQAFRDSWEETHEAKQGYKPIIICWYERGPK